MFSSGLVHRGSGTLQVPSVLVLWLLYISGFRWEWRWCLDGIQCLLFWLEICSKQGQIKQVDHYYELWVKSRSLRCSVQECWCKQVQSERSVMNKQGKDDQTRRQHIMRGADIIFSAAACLKQNLKTICIEWRSFFFLNLFPADHSFSWRSHDAAFFFQQQHPEKRPMSFMFTLCWITFSVILCQNFLTAHQK